MLQVKVYIRSAWWWLPITKTIYFAAVCRIIPLKSAEKAINFILGRAHKIRVGKGKWQRLNEFRLSMVRCNGQTK